MSTRRPRGVGSSLVKKTEIAVATPVGLTKRTEVKEIVAQGSGGAALASGADIARGLDSYFSSSLDEISYGWVRLQPLPYQDEISRLATTVNTTRTGSMKIYLMMDQKGLKCHPTKTGCIAIGRGKTGGGHIFVNPELGLKPCLVVIIKNYCTPYQV